MTENKGDDFAPKTKEIIAQRSGYRCSEPNCRKLTHGPKASTSLAMHLGEAAHITASRPGGARYDKDMSPTKRKSPENGIWMCINHARMIDKDEKPYTIKLLHEWKTTAETLAEREMKYGIQMDNNSLEAFKLAIEEQIRQEQQEVVCLNLTNGSVEE